MRGSLDFLRIPAVWMCFWFFLLYAVVLSVIQAFAPNVAGQLHGMPYALSAICLTAYMLSSAGGMGLGHVVPLMVPILFGVLMDHQQYSAIFLGLAVVQGVLVFSAFNVRRVRRSVQVLA